MLVKGITWPWLGTTIVSLRQAMSTCLETSASPRRVLVMARMSSGVHEEGDCCYMQRSNKDHTKEANLGHNCAAEAHLSKKKKKEEKNRRRIIRRRRRRIRRFMS